MWITFLFLNGGHLFFIGYLLLKEEEMWITSTLPLWSISTLDWFSTLGRRDVDHIYFATVEDICSWLII
jgi:hypothetical protein